jgi:hypothetical protein
MHAHPERKSERKLVSGNLRSAADRAIRLALETPLLATYAESIDSGHVSASVGLHENAFDRRGLTIRMAVSEEAVVLPLPESPVGGWILCQGHANEPCTEQAALGVVRPIGDGKLVLAWGEMGITYRAERMADGSIVLRPQQPLTSTD